MSSNQCYVCSNIVDIETNEDIRYKYYNIVGYKLYSGSNLCYICSHMTQKLWRFHNICRHRGVEAQYDSEKELNWALLFGLTKDSERLLDLQMSSLTNVIVCSEAECNDVKGNHFDVVAGDVEDVLVNDGGVTVEELDQFQDNNYADYFKEDLANSLEENQSVNVISSQQSTDDISDISIVESVADDGSMSYDDKQDVDVEDNMDYDIPKTEEELLVEEKVRRLENRHFTKILLSYEEQKSGIEKLRKTKKYMEAEFKCYSCGIGFLYKDSYRTHMVRHEESNGQYTCAVCTLRFATPSAHRMHVSLHSIKYVCSVCDSVLSSCNRKKHRQTCWWEPVEPVSCHLCGKIFNDNSGLQQHLKRFHSTKIRRHNYTCNICGKKYTDQTGLRTHLIVHTDRVFKCQQCNRTYTNPITLAHHKKTHTNTHTQNFYCTLCNTFYATKKLLRKHEKNSAAHQQFSYECPACTRTYATKKSLESHINTIHSAVKPFECGLCPARYSTNKSLMRHCKIHTDYVQGKKFICDICGKCYRGKSKLTRHLTKVCERNKTEQVYQLFSENLVAI